MSAPSLTDQHYRILEHMLIGSSRSEIPYRNHYCAGRDHESRPLLDDLVALGLVVWRPYPLDQMDESRMYHATTAGTRRWIEWRNAAGKGPRLYRPANAEDGRDHEALYCDRCERNAAFRRDGEGTDQCSILGGAMLFPVDHQSYPVQWLETKDGGPTCTAFVRESEAG